MRPATLRQCVVRVGGRNGPSPLRPVGGRPFLAWMLRELARFGVEEALLLADEHTGGVEQAVAGLAASLPRPLRITLARVSAAGGSGGTLYQARGALHEGFLLCDANRLLAGNLARLLADAAADDDAVIGRLVLHAPSGGETGIACFGPGLRARLTPACSLEGDILPALRTTMIEGYFRDLRDVDADGTDLAAGLARPALFLDRDGVINRDHGWVGTRARFEWMPGIETAIREACDAGWHVFVVTNQSGVARGLYSEADLHDLHAWMADHLRRAGGTIDDLRYCPTHPEAPLAEYRRESDWRKPGPGMILDLIRCWQLDPARCVLVGDKPTDLAAAAAAGIAARLFEGGDVVRCLAAARAAIRP